MAVRVAIQNSALLADGGHMGTWGVVLMKNLKVFLVMSSREFGGQSVCKAASKPLAVCTYREGLTQNENYYDLV